LLSNRIVEHDERSKLPHVKKFKEVQIQILQYICIFIFEICLWYT